MSSGCGVLFGDPIRLFPSHDKLDGGADVAQCVEQADHMTGSALTIVGVPARNMEALVEGPRNADIIWPGIATSSVVTVTASNVSVYSVYSRANEYIAHRSDVECSDHVRIDATVSISTVDGRLNENLGKVSFIAYTETEASANVTLPKAALKGTYAPQSPPGKPCFAQTTFRLLAEPEATNGAMLDEFHASCTDSDAGIITTLAGGHWGPDWLN